MADIDHEKKAVRILPNEYAQGMLYGERNFDLFCKRGETQNSVFALIKCRLYFIETFLQVISFFIPKPSAMSRGLNNKDIILIDSYRVSQCPQSVTY